MTNPMIKIVNATTGEEIEREMNDAEFVQFQKDKVESDAAALKIEEFRNAKITLLEKLGITEDEAKLLLS